jgi:hypothetical protein
MARKSHTGYLHSLILSLAIGSILITWPLIKLKYAEDEPWFEKDCVTSTAAITNLDFSRVYLTASPSGLPILKGAIESLAGENLPHETRRVAVFDYENDKGLSFLMAFDSNNCAIHSTFIESRIVPFIMVPLKNAGYWNDPRPGA